MKNVRVQLILIPNACYTISTQIDNRKRSDTNTNTKLFQ